MIKDGFTCSILKQKYIIQRREWLKIILSDLVE